MFILERQWTLEVVVGHVHGDQRHVAGGVEVAIPGCLARLAVSGPVNFVLHHVLAAYFYSIT